MDERVERGMRRQLAEAPPDRIGWKMALNAPAIMERLGLPEPALGGLFRSRVAEGSHSLAGATAPAVEPELLLEAAADGSLARIGVALEVVDFDMPLDDVEEVIAGGVFHRAVALSSLVDPVEPREAVFRLNDDERARVSSFEAPSETLAFVQRFLREAGAALAEGDLVIAGALSGPTPVAAGDTASLTVTNVGSVSLSFSE